MQKKLKYVLTQSWLKVKPLVVLSLLLAFAVNPVKAQFAYFTNSPAKDFFKDISVTHLFESEFGFIWLGTDQGIYRYDGLSYKPYLLENDSLERSRSVSTIYEDANQLIWIGFEDGQIYHPTYEGGLEPWMGNQEITINKPVTNIYKRGQETWIATYGQGLYIQTPDSLYLINTDNGLLADDIYEMVLDSQGTAYLATDRGINIIKLEEQAIELESVTADDGLPGYVIRTLLPDQSGGFWAGTYDNGVFYWNPEQQSIRTPFENWEYGIVNSLELFEDQELWIGTERKGLIQYDLKTQSAYNYTEINDLGVGRIFDLHKDKEGNLWVLSNALSVIKSNRKFEFLEKESTTIRNIQAIFSDHDNQLWVGTQEGVYQVSQENGRVQYQRELPQIESNILSLYEDPYHNLWIGTFGEGIYIYNLDNGAIRQLGTTDGLVDGSVLSIDGYDNKIYVGTLAGVTQFTINENVIREPDIPYNQYNADDKLNAAFIYKVFVDSKGNVWLGTDSEGINRIQNDRLTYFSGSDQVRFNSVYSITEDLQGNIWFTTLNEGIFRYDGQEFERFGTEEGLRNLNISSLITDRQGNILILHPSGIDIMNPQTGQIIYFGEEVGIKSLEPNLNVVCRDRTGDIWIGGQKQILKYLSQKETFRVVPQTTLDQVDVSGSILDFTAKNDFPYNQNSFLFKFKGLWFTDPESVQYRYRLEGLDQDWIYTRDQEVNYINLRPGKYAFQVGSTANNTFSQEPASTYSFTIRKPFWERTWFILSAIAFLAWATWYSLRVREKRVMRESRLRKEKIESQFEALKSQINPHFLFNSFNTLVAIIEENPDQAVSYVERLSDFYRSILQYREKAVIPIAEEINVVQNYYYLLKERFGKNLNLHIDVQEKEAFVPPLSLQMLVENAIKHNIVSAQKPLDIYITQGEKGVLSVRNTMQPKRVRPKSTAFGLSSIVARFALLSDKKVIVNQNKKEFSVILPLIKSEFKQLNTDPTLGLVQDLKEDIEEH